MICSPPPLSTATLPNVVRAVTLTLDPLSRLMVTLPISQRTFDAPPARRPLAVATRTRRVPEGAAWNGGGAGRDAPAGLADSTDSRESRRAAPSSAEILPEATWFRISRLRSFMSQIRTYHLPICQLPLQN